MIKLLHKWLFEKPDPYRWIKENSDENLRRQLKFNEREIRFLSNPPANYPMDSRDRWLPIHINNRDMILAELKERGKNDT